MMKHLLLVMLVFWAGCTRSYQPKLQAELLLLADPVVKKWHADGFTIQHAFSAKYHAEAEHYMIRELQPMFDLLSSHVKSTEEWFAEIECIKRQYAGTDYEKDALAVWELLSPVPHIGPVAEPTNGWSSSSEDKPSNKKAR